MPIYEFQCKDCGTVQEILLKRMTEGSEELLPCEKCGALTEQTKLMSPPNHIYKGSGFYATDYKQKPTGQKEEK
jgi:putative FmdB family regulatory protein